MSQPDLFNYTSGRWIYNETLRLAERQQFFNIALLNRIVAASIGRPDQDVTCIRKLAEGGQPIYATASEVATMELVRLHGVPVPRILTYSATDQNPVGSEYIIMEKAAGNELGDLWYTMAERQRLKMIFEIVKIEALLFSIQLPGYGSIYYEHELPPSMRRIGLQQAGGNGKFCVGPDALYKWWQKGRSSLSTERGPFSETGYLLESVAKRELEWLLVLVGLGFPLNRCAESYMHSFEVVSLIDWQHSILPLFLQAGPPKYFQIYGDAVSEDLIKPQLPSDFDQLGENEQEAARINFQQRQLHYYYFAATAKFNDDHFSACTEDDVVLKQQLFQHTGDPWEGDSVTLKADLIRVVQNWERLYASTVSVCPLHYSPAEIDGCLRLEEEQRLADDDMEKSRNCLGVSGDGWVPTERYSEAKKMSEKFKAEAILLADSEEVAAQIQRHWPFDEHDEDD
ncbi:hypothetical protein IFM62136_00617 [Aspergillus lentulus]|nr:hypothetical protein IFM62136_00617 [Aspergillus lentulus]